MFMPILAVSAVHSDVLIYDESVEVNAELDIYQKLTAGRPIQGSIMITHQASTPIDEKSFKLGDEPLVVRLDKTVQMSPYSKTVLTIYRFQLKGKPAGEYNLGPIKVRVGGKYFESNPLTIQVSQ